MARAHRPTTFPTPPLVWCFPSHSLPMSSQRATQSAIRLITVMHFRSILQPVCAISPPGYDPCLHRTLSPVLAPADLSPVKCQFFSLFFAVTCHLNFFENLHIFGLKQSISQVENFVFQFYPVAGCKCAKTPVSLLMRRLGAETFPFFPF